MSKTMKVSDAIALFLKEKGIKHVFGIIGAANAHIFDSIYNLGYTQVVCVHHEQVATMAMQTYYRTSGEITAAIVTAGGGSSNAITGVVSAWADSIPGMVISGQENTKYINAMLDMRMWGIQGFNSTRMVEMVTKYAVRVMEPLNTLAELEKAYSIAGSTRPGPVWIDFPMDVQGSIIDETEAMKRVSRSDIVRLEPSIDAVNDTLGFIEKAVRPVFWIGNGIRLAGAQEKVRELLSVFPFPTITAWAGLDLLDTDHDLNYGRAGNYGNRAANFVVQNADLIIAIGTRLSLPMIGYDHKDFARAAKKIMVDIDRSELQKLEDILDLAINADAGRFMDILIKRGRLRKNSNSRISTWKETCDSFRSKYPLIGPEHDDKNGYINSYRIIDRLCAHFKDDQIVTTDMGTALLSGHEAIRIKRNQRMMTSTGLGEMGYGLPAAIGASFARNKGEVLCLNCDGGMMMNLQELQTVAFHKLPIKIIVFNNDGYLMIRHTQKNLFKGRYSASNRASGVSCPDFSKIAAAFDLPYFSIRTWKEFDEAIPRVQAAKEAVICDIFMDPEQYFYPKQGLAINADGKIVSPPLEDLSPLLPRAELKENMIIGIHPKSEGLH